MIPFCKQAVSICIGDQLNSPETRPAQFDFLREKKRKKKWENLIKQIKENER